jgi:hypothetical protein
MRHQNVSFACRTKGQGHILNTILRTPAIATIILEVFVIAIG